MAVILLVSGVYYPIEVLPKWLQWGAYIGPAFYSLNGMRAALLEGKPVWQLGPELSGLALTGVLFIPLGYAIFSWGERYAKKTGLLKRNG